MSKGFSLMEVLVAMAILGITFTVLFGLLSGSLRNIDRVSEREKILRLARMKLNELIIQANQGTAAPQSFGQWGDRYRWKSSIVTVSPEEGQESPSQQSPPYLLARIKLSVTWISRGNEIEFPLETATWMPVVEKDEK
jgi:prepilin-type N-terminal cleavage/methylation domain-containing protein